MKSLIFLLILDFSGSMYQPLKNQKKYEVLKQNVSTFNQSLSEIDLKQNSGILLFGLNPKKKCDDIQYANVENKFLSKEINRYLPGPFSKTPLGESISRGTDITIENKVKKVIIFSDGADTCGKDPCKVLVESNDKLIKANYIMNIKFIGLNLDNNDPKFACFRNNTLSNINIDYSNITDSYEVQNELKKEIQIDPKTLEGKNGILEVKGAPSNAKFTSNAKKSWSGNYQIVLPKGSNTINSTFKGTKSVKVFLEADEKKEIFWSDFFKEPIKKVKIQNVYSAILTPSTQTQEAHRNISPILIEGDSVSVEKDFMIPFGEWKIEIISPQWVKENIKGTDLEIKPELSHQKIYLEKYFPVDWISPPYTEMNWVFSIKLKEESKKAKEKNFDEVETQVKTQENFKEKEKRYFLQSGIQKIPVPLNSEVNWIQAGP